MLCGELVNRQVGDAQQALAASTVSDCSDHLVIGAQER
jgi:hypothetical protein